MVLEIMWYIQFFQKRSFQSDLYKGPIGLLDYTNFNFNGNFIFFFKKSLEEARLDNTVHSGNLISALLASYDINEGVFKWVFSNIKVLSRSCPADMF